MSTLAEPTVRVPDASDLDFRLGTEQDPGRPLRPSGNLRRRHFVSSIASLLATAAAFIAVAVMIIVLWTVISRGASAINWKFLTTGTKPFETAGGIGPAILGTGWLLFMATAIAMPVGILTALHTSEFAGRRSASIVKLALDLLNGLPSIVIGIFAFGLFVVGHHQSAFAGAFALAIIMIPLIARASQEALSQVPTGLREAANALGVGRRQAVLGVILPSAMGGILTGTILAAARAAGETAPLIFVCSIASSFSLDPSQAIINIPVMIFTASEAADPTGYARAWGAGLILVCFILTLSVLGRYLFGRKKIS